ncbi:MAG: HEAT repeat domain-containing protein, partial [Gemmatimonadaceae bacterium]|nr:HEAT repeat domain-containing protein [Gemmatimonadaceae bacterium]
MMSAVVRGRQTSRLMLVAACTVASTWVFCTPADAQQGEVTKYLDLSSSADLGPGHLILSINRQQVPAGWSIDWYVALYSPKGIRVGLGRLADNADGTGTIAVRVPAGRHRYEFSRKAGDRTQLSGAFDFDKGHWVPPSDETVVITSGSVDIPKDGLVSLQLRYDAPSVSRHEDPKSHDVTVLMTLTNARTDIASATPDKLPASAISRHVLMKYATFGDLAERHVITALLDTGSTDEIATTALLKAKSIDASMLTAEIQGAVGRPRWGLARVVAKTGDQRLVPPILRWLALTPTADQSPLLWALGELRDPAAVPVLREALTSSANVNRVYAAHALGRIADT